MVADEVNVTERILDKLDRIDETLRMTGVDIAEIKVDLNYHVMRTDLAEETIAEVRKDTNNRLVKLEKWSDKWHYLGWLVAGIIGFASQFEHIVDLTKKL